MQITVYSGFKKAINSTKTPTGGSTVNVALKTPTSEMRPIFLISGFDLSWNYIQWGSSYYYVDDIVIVSNTQAEYHCEKDVLATFKSDITASSQFVTRSASSYDAHVIDGIYPTIAGASINTQNFSMGESLTGAGTYVVGVVSADSTGGVAYYTFGAGGTRFKNFVTYMFSDAWLDPNADISVEIQKELVNPFQYVVSCVWYPFSIAGTDAHVKFGYWDSGVSGGLLSESQRLHVISGSLSLPRHPQASTNGVYMNSAPYTRYLLDCYTFGQIPLDPAPFVDYSGLSIDVIVDVFAAAAELRVTNSGGTYEHRYNADFGVTIPLSQLTEKTVQAAVGVVGGTGAGAVAGSALGPVGAIVGGVLGAAGGVMAGINNLFPQVQTSGGIGSKNAYARTPFVQCEFYKTPTIAPSIVGRPLMTQITLSGLSGYTVCERVDLDTSACPEEKTAIIQHMTNGFFIE